MDHVATDNCRTGEPRDVFLQLWQQVVKGGLIEWRIAKPELTTEVDTG